MLGWFEGGLPFIVARRRRPRVVGFARVAGYSDRCVYEGVGEHAVYVDDRRAAGGRPAPARGDRVGAERQGFYKLTSRVFTTNAASLAAHRAAGFYEVGVQPRHGRLDGEWKDCVLVERLLGDAAVPDAPRSAT